jgi:hypothetical protein
LVDPENAIVVLYQIPTVLVDHHNGFVGHQTRPLAKLDLGENQNGVERSAAGREPAGQGAYKGE